MIQKKSAVDRSGQDYKEALNADQVSKDILIFYTFIQFVLPLSSRREKNEQKEVQESA
jgi:hypothetical protein